MKGEVEKIWKNETEDGRKYEVFQINGERYSLWDENYLGQIPEGQALEFEYKESGDFKNITKVYNPGDDGSKENAYGDQRTRRIVKMSSLRSASRVLVGSKIPTQDRADKTIEIAKKFEKYINKEDFDGHGD